MRASHCVSVSLFGAIYGLHWAIDRWIALHDRYMDRTAQSIYGSHCAIDLCMDSTALTIYGSVTAQSLDPKFAQGSIAVRDRWILRMIQIISASGGTVHCWSRNCFAHFSTHAFHCIFIIITTGSMISM